MSSDDLTPHLAEVICSGYGESGADEHDMAAARAVLASGLVVPTSAVNAAIAAAEARGTYPAAMRELRALTRQENP